ncbi:MAG: DUF2075 domain-containing protein [Bifidobacterium sp.]|jgi:hypothetical protein|nr:DUF2075 domain-containing protein [Bifidobacterium sp.]
MSHRIPQSLIAHLPYAALDRTDVADALCGQVIDMKSRDNSYIELITTLLVGFPAVYVVHTCDKNQTSSDSEYSVYVGETNNIRARTVQHLKSDAIVREDWKEFSKRLARNPRSVWQYIIGNPHFNKSLTLDVENRLMHYLLGVPSVRNLNNRRSNAQGDYYTREEFDGIFNDIWLQLHEQDPNLFPSEQIIRDSALFKASPFHALSDDQKAAEESILSVIIDLLYARRHASNAKGEEPTRLIVVQGAAGTGKTVLLSHLFYRIETDLGLDGIPDDENDGDGLENSVGQISTMGQKSDRTADRRDAYILVNHHEQANVYNQIVTKLGLQKKRNDVVLVPSAFINKFSEPMIGKDSKLTHRGDPDRPKGKADIVLVDEGHLLLTQGNQGYSGQNQLHDILRRSRIVILIFDPKQALQTAQQWDTPTLDQLLVGDNAASGGSPYASDTSQFRPFDLCGDHYEIEHIRLSQQFRIAANQPVIDWLDHFASGAGVDPLPKDPGEYDNDGKLCRVPYEIRVFDSPLDLFKAIEQKAALPSDGVNGCGLSRVLATYDWEFTTTHTNPHDPNGLWNVELHRDVQGRWQMGLGKDEEYNFCQPWNYQLSDTSRTRGLQKNLSWAEKPYTINEIGSTFTIQGFDLNFAGVIIGPSVKYRNGRLIFDPNASRNSLATRRRKGKIDYSQKNLCNELNVLLKRGVHGLYLFAVDSQLQARLREISDAVQDVGTNDRG